MIVFENPVMTKEDGPKSGERMSHPAFGQIGAFRTSGQTYLYGSDFKHHNYIRITITPSEMVRSINHDWFFGKSLPYIDVAMSEAQWATFVSSMNVGSGVPCTVQALDGKNVPQLPPEAQEAQKDKHLREVEQDMKSAMDALKELQDKISQSGLSEKKASVLREFVQKAARAISDSAPYAVKSFDEHMEKTVERVKIEVNAYATTHLMSLGRAALEDQTPAVEMPSLNAGEGE